MVYGKYIPRPEKIDRESIMLICIYHTDLPCEEKGTILLYHNAYVLGLLTRKNF